MRVQSAMIDIADRRRWYAGLWGAVLLVATLASASDAMAVVAWMWIAALGLLVMTAWRAKLGRDERLVWRCYRWVGYAMAAVAVFGVALAGMPNAADGTRWLAPLFAIIAALGWRAAVARGPSAAFLTVTITLITWLPFLLPLSLKCCKRPFGLPPPPPHWTQPAMFASLHALVLLSGLLAIAALLSFAPRTDDVPEARVV